MQPGSVRRISAAALVAICAGTLPAGAQSVADFYRGKTVQLVIPSNMGGSVGLYGKLAADHIGRHIPGNPNVILIQMPGGDRTAQAGHYPEEIGYGAEQSQKEG